MIESYRQGKRDGEWVHFDETGEKMIRQEQFKAGIPHGKWITWYPSGKKRREITFQDGRVLKVPQSFLQLSFAGQESKPVGKPSVGDQDGEGCIVM